MAYWVIYTNALDMAIIHIPGCLSTIFCRVRVGIESSFLGFSPESCCTDGSPLLSGVSDTKNSTIRPPATPAAAAKMKPHFQPHRPTMTPVNMKVRNLPRYGLALKML